MGILFGAVTLTANAQNSQRANLEKVSAFENMYQRPLGLNNFKNLPDQMLQQVGKRISAKGAPTKAMAQQLMQRGMAEHSLMMQGAKRVAAQPRRKANYMASDTIFWESFEGWDGETMPWLPADVNNWTTKSNVADLTPYLASGLCPTWTTYQGDGYYVPYATHGDQMLVCMFGGEAYAADGVTVTAPAPQQDEWLVSPTINGISKDNFLSFDICYSPWQSHYFIEGNDTVFDPTRVSYNVEVLLTTNTRSVSYDAANYTKVFDLTEEVDKQLAATDMNDNAAVTELLYMQWKHIQLPLAEYDGKNIRIALRYTGSKGGSVLVDGLRVSDLLPVAMYDLPEGSFNWGFSETAKLFQQMKMGLVPAYVPTVWNNYSNEDSKSFVWNYKDADGKEQKAQEYNLTMAPQASSMLLEMPKLTAQSGVRADEYANGYFKVGGNAVYANEGTAENFYVGNFDPTKMYWTGEISATGTQKVYAFGSGSGAFYGSLSNYTFNSVDGIGNFYEAPAAPYVFNTVLLPLGEFFNMGATLACTIYKVKNGNEITDEVIAQATVVDGEQIAGGWFLVFDFQQSIVVDDAIFVLIDGFSNSNLLEIAPLSQALNHDSNKGYAFVKLNAVEGGFGIIDVANLLAGLEGSGNMCVSHCIGMNAVFPYLHSMEGDYFVAGNEGAEKSFTIDSYWDPKDLELSCDAAWVKAETVVDELEQTVSLKITASALPEGVSGRHAEVKLTGLACEQVITVLQGTDATSINAVAAEAKTNGQFNLAGQRINANAAGKGIYLTKKNGKYIKVMK